MRYFCLFFIICIVLVLTEIIENNVDPDGEIPVTNLPSTALADIPSFNVPIKLGTVEQSNAQRTILLSIGADVDFYTTIDTFCITHMIVSESCIKLKEIHYPSYLIQMSKYVDKLDYYKSIRRSNDEILKQNHNYFSNSRNSYNYSSGGNILTIVSGWWDIDTNKYEQNLDDKNIYFAQWFYNTLPLKMPYILYTNHDVRDFDKYRDKNTYFTHYVTCDIDSFKSHEIYNKNWTDTLHIPSYKLGLIWIEKINFLYKSLQYSNSEYFAWIDAGLNRYRNKKVPNEEFNSDVILSLPRDRVTYAYVSDIYHTHSFSGGYIVVHRTIIPTLHHLFYDEFRQCSIIFNDWRCGSDQILFTRIREKYPELFHIGSYNYGDINFLWANKYEEY